MLEKIISVINGIYWIISNIINEIVANFNYFKLFLIGLIEVDFMDDSASIKFKE